MAFGLGLDRGADVLGKGSYRFAFNGKEIDNQGEWGQSTKYNFGARIYNPSIAVFQSRDRFSRAYSSLSPYIYAADSPLSIIEVNGDSIWVTAETVENADGTYTNYQTIRGTVKVYDTTGDVDDLDGIAGQLESELRKTLRGKDGTVVVRSNIEVSAVESMNEVKESDHLIVIVDDVVPDGWFTSRQGLARMNGKIGYAEFHSGFLKTMVHEFGHNIGLKHSWEDGYDDTNTDLNYMSYGGSARKSFSASQIIQIKRNVDQMNQGENFEIAPKTTNNWFWNTSSNLKPYYFNVSKGDKIPKIIR
jgi:RHS repeat-associated protein